MVGPGKAVPDAVLVADPVEDVAAKDGLDLRVAAAVPGQVGEGHTAVGQHGVQLVGEGGHDLAQEGGTLGLGVGVEGGDVGELGHLVDREGHEQLALGQAELADVADLDLGKTLSPGSSLLVPRQARDAVAHQAAVQGAAGEGRDRLAQATEHIVQRQ
jgi:hypothetical protein